MLYSYSVPELSGKEAAWLATLFDVGGIFGAVLIGFISDRLRSRSLTCVSLLALAIPLVSVCIEVNLRGGKGEASIFKVA